MNREHKKINKLKEIALTVLGVLLVVGGVYASLHYLFVLGLIAFTIALWRRKVDGSPLVSSRQLFAIALLVWLFGAASLTKSFWTRPESWYPEVRMRFSGWNARQSVDDHHKIVSPETRAERLPAVFDTLRVPTELQAEFMLLPDGTVTQPRILRTSGNAEVDQAVLAQVRRWHFGALPEGFKAVKPSFLPWQKGRELPPMSETIRVKFFNNYTLSSFYPKLSLFAFLYPLLGFLAIRWLGDAVLRRVLVVVWLLGGVSWLLLYRLGPDQGRLDLVEKQSLFLIVGQLILIALPHGLPRLRQLRQRLLAHLSHSPLGARVLEFFPPNDGLVASWLPCGWGLVVASVLLLLFTRVFGTSGGTEATLWIPLGPLGNFQTIEGVKLLMVGFVALAAFGITRSLQQLRGTAVVAMRSQWDRVFWLVLAFGIILLCLGIMKDMGPALLLLLFLAFFFPLLRQTWASRVALTALVALALLGYGVGSVTQRLPQNALTKLFTHTYQRTRIWLHTFEVQPGERADGHEQVALAQWAVSSGGAFGQGLGNGKAARIAAVESDFVLAVLVEELGCVGGATLLLCLVFIPVTLIKKSLEVEVLYEKVYISGIGILLGIQASLIVGGNLRLLPLTGITLPWISYGGSSTLMNYLAVALAVGTYLHPGEGGLLDGAEQQVFDSRLRNPVRFLQGTTALFILVLALRQLPAPLGSQSNAELRILVADGTERRRTNPRLSEPVGVRLPSGQIKTVDGELLMETARARGIVLHQSPSLSLVESDLRLRLSETLSGSSQGQVELRGDIRQRGFDVVLTIDSHLQKLAEQTLERSGYAGSIVGLDPKTGKIRFAASRSHVPQTAETGWYQISYFPGSTFKTIVMAAGLSKGVWTPNTALDCPPTYLGRGEFGGSASAARFTAAQALVASRNTWFMKATNELLGGEALEQFCTEHAGFGQRFSLLPDSFRADGQQTWLQSEPSLLSESTDTLSKPGLALALTGIGQRDVRMTPLHLAAWAGALANGGKFVEPTLLERIEDNRGNALWKSTPHPIGTPIPAATVAALKPMMRGVIQRGTAAAAFQGCKIPVWGKTGTAERDSEGQGGKRRNDGLFIGYSENLAIAVVLEDIGANKQSGGRKAAPLARMIFEIKSK